MLYFKEHVGSDDVLDTLVDCSSRMEAMKWMLSVRETQDSSHGCPNARGLGFSIVSSWLGRIQFVDEKLGGPSLKVLGKEYQQGVHAPSILERVLDKLSIDHSATGPGTVRMELEKVIRTILVDAKLAVES